MSGKPKKQSEQAKRFIETARKLGCDEDEAAFDERLRRIGTAKPEKAENKPKRRGSRR